MPIRMYSYTFVTVRRKSRTVRRIIRSFASSSGNPAWINAPRKERRRGCRFLPENPLFTMDTPKPRKKPKESSTERIPRSTGTIACFLLIFAGGLPVDHPFVQNTQDQDREHKFDDCHNSSSVSSGRTKLYPCRAGRPCFAQLKRVPIMILPHSYVKNIKKTHYNQNYEEADVTKRHAFFRAGLVFRFPRYYDL